MRLSSATSIPSPAKMASDIMSRICGSRRRSKRMLPVSLAIDTPNLLDVIWTVFAFQSFLKIGRQGRHERHDYKHDYGKTFSPTYFCRYLTFISSSGAAGRAIREFVLVSVIQRAQVHSIGSMPMVHLEFSGIQEQTRKSTTART